jgi:CRP/FNR family cyclic AMP-dependent transcriptional regulator
VLVHASSMASSSDASPAAPPRGLGGVPLLADWPEAARRRFAAAAQPARFGIGETIFRRGDSGESGMLLLLDGLVRLHLAEAGGRELTLALVRAGETIGELAVIDDGPRSADATALTPVSGLQLRRADAKALMASDPAVTTAVLRGLAAMVRRTTGQVEAVGLHPLPRRLAGALLTLAAADPAGLVRLPQGQIASLVAASRPKVNAVLAEFRARGLVSPHRAGLRLADPVGLQALAEEGSAAPSVAGGRPGA